MPGTDATAIELYRTAFARLTFQDEYLFKFSAIFLTIQGALAVLAGAEFRASAPNAMALLVLSLLGLSLAGVWWLWIRQNDYWHSVWTGALRDLEDQMNSHSKLFALDHPEIANAGGRGKALVWRGHLIAGFVPLILLVGWLVLLGYSIVTM